MKRLPWLVLIVLFLVVPISWAQDQDANEDESTPGKRVHEHSQRYADAAWDKFLSNDNHPASLANDALEIYRELQQLDPNSGYDAERLKELHKKAKELIKIGREHQANEIVWGGKLHSQEDIDKVRKLLIEAGHDQDEHGKKIDPFTFLGTTEELLKARVVTEDLYIESMNNDTVEVDEEEVQDEDLKDPTKPESSAVAPASVPAQTAKECPQSQ